MAKGFPGNGLKIGKGFAFGWRQNDVIFGGWGDDDIDTGPGYDIVHAGWGNDTVRLGESGLVFGGWGDDRIFAGTGTLTAFGGFGDDQITLGAGDDTVDGGHGFDTAILSGSITDYTITARGRGQIILESEQGEPRQPAQDRSAAIRRLHLLHRWPQQRRAGRGRCRHDR
ncbi:calcium-binding protein [Ponticoccus litoralis]|uniref:Calcium-binding protein n=1 Tax=Ponticoccus litoralis TaxID=422297 RepID=A0AAW9SVS1_9RHOB